MELHSEGEAAARARRRTPLRKGGAAVGPGLLSLAFALAKLVAPRTLTRVAGLPDAALAAGLVRALGARELVIGVGLLTGRRPAPWLWSRVAGDAVELGLLGAALHAARAKASRAAGVTALAVMGGVAALDLACALAASRVGRSRLADTIHRSVTIARPRDDVYRFWRDFANVPAFMAGVESVEVLDALRSRWSARGPVGPVVSWEVTVVDDRPGELLRWCSVEGAASDVRADGVVRFSDAPGARGTEVRVEIGYGPPDDAAGRIAAFIAAARTPERIEADLARCKQLLETGRVVRSEREMDAPGADEAPPAEAAS
jgi:uncharacterized membrane protein